jgi:hypothetical protein
MNASYPYPRLLCIGTKRGVNYGTVYDLHNPLGTLRTLGKVRRESKVAAGFKGQRRTFYTAQPTMPNGWQLPALGTRHPTRWHAARAIRMFHDAYPLIGKGYMDRHAAAHAARCFKYDYWRECGLSERNLANPRVTAR